MTVGDELVQAAAGAPVIEAPISWRDCPSDELRAIAGRGPHGGELYFAAAAELERRAQESEAEATAKRAEAAARRQHLVLLAAGLIALVTGIVLLWRML